MQLLSICCNDTMPEHVIKKREDQLDNNNYKNNNINNGNRPHHQQCRHNTFLSQILVSILLAALVGTTGGTIALATMVEGGISSMLFPSAEAAPVYMCDFLIATIVGKLGAND